MEASGVWMSILDYAQFKSISISSIRRYIKAGRVKSKKENGKFFIFVSQEKLEKSSTAPNFTEKKSLELELENQRLKEQMKRMREEIDELQMLVNLYEMRMPTKESTSEMPAVPQL